METKTFFDKVSFIVNKVYYTAVVPKVWGAPPWGGARDPQGGRKRCKTILFTKINKKHKKIRKI
jgi:hypothetical protein